MKDETTPSHTESERTRLAGVAVARFADGVLTPTDPVFDELRTLDAAEDFTMRLAARVVARRASDGRWLLFRYPDRGSGPRWVVPGGGVEPGESFETAAVREMLDETGAAAVLTGPSGLLLHHRIPDTTAGVRRIQYAPILVGTIADELPDTDYRDPVWITAAELLAVPDRTAVVAPLAELLDATERDVVFAPRAVWLP